MLTISRVFFILAFVLGLSPVYLQAGVAYAGCSTNSVVDSTASALAAGATQQCDIDGRNHESGPNHDDTAAQPAGAATGKPAKTELQLWEEKRDQITTDNKNEATRYSDCVANQPYYVTCQDPRLQTIPGRPKDAPAADQPLGETLPPEVVAYTAVARLKLTPPKPVIGPPPSINQWKVAAVGYPLWLSVDANLDPPAATDRVYDLSVSIKARLSRVTFDMGDGQSKTCTDLTHAWKRYAVEPGTPSPTCGYTYTKPSLPAGKYTITAYSTWTVDVTINDRVIPVIYRQQSSTTLPVGELQVTVR